MAGRGPPPKNPATRQRTNKKSTALDLETPSKPKLRPMPRVTGGRKWARETRAWWRSVCESAMSLAFLETDWQGLGRLAILIDDFHKADTPSLRKELQTEIRLQETRYGLAPDARARLEWTILPRREEPDRETPAPPKPPDRTTDPRGLLRAVK